MPSCPIPAGPRRRSERRASSVAQALLALALVVGIASPAQAAVALDKLRLPPGFRIELVTDAVPNARQMALGRSADGKSTVYVGSRSAGKVYALQIEAGRAGPVRTVASGLEMPSGVALHDGSLYVAAVSKILRFDGIDDRLAHPPAPAVVTDKLPERAASRLEIHRLRARRRALRAGRRAVQRLRAERAPRRDPAHEARRQRPRDVGARRAQQRRLRLEPGRQDALVHRERPRHARRRPARRRAQSRHPRRPALRLPVLPPGRHRRPGVRREAALQRVRRRRRRTSGRTWPRSACASTPAAKFPQAYRGNVFIAEHGSWNRSSKVGYRLEPGRGRRPGRAGKPETFVDGWLQGESAWGRPADVLVLPDGSLLVSDDLAGAIYRIRYAP